MVLSDVLPWVLLTTTLGVALWVDLSVLRRHDQGVEPHEALGWALCWIALGLTPGLIFWFWRGPTIVGEYLAAYLKSFNMDQLFVFAAVFNAFQLSAVVQYRVLFWGSVLGLPLRIALLGLGDSLVNAVHGLIYIFGIALIVLGIKMMHKFRAPPKLRVDADRLVTLTRHVFPRVTRTSSATFFVRVQGQWMATPLLLALVSLECLSAFFMLDEIPALMSVSRDVFVLSVASSMALLGLRALYFVLGEALNRVSMVRLGVGILLAVAGVKLLVSDLVKVPIEISLTVTIAILGTCIGVAMQTSATKPVPKA
ncbi:MAG: TerC family protein [Chloroflexota bacterium]